MNILLSRRGADSFVAAGTVSAIYAIDEKTVIKARPSSGDFECQAYDIEIRAYERLGYHERIASCTVTEEGLLLERGTCLRGMLQNVNKSGISWAMKLRWALEAADGLAYIHSKGVIHADVGCHNVIVDTASHVNLLTLRGPASTAKSPWSAMSGAASGLAMASASTPIYLHLDLCFLNLKRDASHIASWKRLWKR